MKNKNILKIVGEIFVYNQMIIYICSVQLNN
uniref:Uncharacterized protein n=1 Tax=Siphoviridae sp. ctREU2 TaxID=2826333 RepID=A0A8S5NJX7_9CAUD|nr:MAG TPA: hypothetical protein [Siphoviridae sp. ctREU2]